ncbi:MAG: M23 family metallopeptidase [Burkholderiales bacterium]|nr:M23 family metallopeptidase [Burkholderiales bacterium]
MAGLAAGQVARQAAGPSPGSSLGSAAPPRPQAEAGPPARPRPPASGGPLLPPRPEADMSDAAGVADEGGALGLLQDRLARVAQQLARVADAATLQRLALMRLPTRLPVAGAELTSGFGNREDPLTGQRAFHDGLDLAVARGTVIRAAAGGRVVYAGLKPDFGRMVEIDHGNGLATLYAHASRLLVTAGAVVLPGDPIAEVGSSGRSTGPHLHFEVLRQGTAIDPRRYLAGL